MKTYSKNQLERFPIYLKYFRELSDEGQTFVSSPQIAKKLGYSEEQVRKDLQAVCDKAGRPKKGRELKSLIETLEAFLGYLDSASAVVIGCGNLGSALMNYPNFESMGLSILAGFDADPARQGTTSKGIPVYGMSQLREKIVELGARVAIITTPASVAQDVVDQAISSGIKAIWNFAPTYISVPSNIALENENLASSLAVLSHRLNELTLKEHR